MLPPVRLRRERLLAAIQQAQMWLDDAHDSFDEEQLRIDGAEALLTSALADLERRRRLMDELGEEIDRAEADLEQAQTDEGSISAY